MMVLPDSSLSSVSAAVASGAMQFAAIAKTQPIHGNEKFSFTGPGSFRMRLGSIYTRRAPDRFVEVRRSGQHARERARAVGEALYRGAERVQHRDVQVRCRRIRRVHQMLT